MKGSSWLNSIELSKIIRKIVLSLSHKYGTAHLGSSLSCADILAVLFTSQLQNYVPREWNKSNDFFILSKGHAATTLYACLYQNNFITWEELQDYSQPGSKLEEHPNSSIPGVITASGSLGHGLSFACGLALGQKVKNMNRHTYVVMSDGECNEGTVWEAAMFASAKGLRGLTVLIDHNGWQATGPIQESIGAIKISELFNAFGWHAVDVNGHDHAELDSVLRQTRNLDHPVAIICHTVKGKGVSFMENDNNWHYKAPDADELRIALKEIEGSL